MIDLWISAGFGAYVGLLIGILLGSWLTRRKRDE